MKGGVTMINEFTECCGWVKYPASQDSHDCSDGGVSQDEMNARGQLVMSADWADDSDY
jgi:hypothetical protein